MRCFQNPVGVFGISNCLVPPFDLEVTGGLFEEGRAGEAVHVEFGLWRHCCQWIWLGRLKQEEYKDCRKDDEY